LYWGLLNPPFFSWLAVTVGGYIYTILSITRIYFFEPTFHASRTFRPPLEKNRTGGTSDKTIPDSELYMHKPLKNETSLRLLLLKKGRNKDPLECELIEFSIDTVAIYEALSYAWGPKTPQKYILCQGPKLPITESCEAALLHLRYPFSGRLL
jgi:Heterokaryon incompatibility protein (HET)